MLVTPKGITTPRLRIAVLDHEQLNLYTNHILAETFILVGKIIAANKIICIHLEYFLKYKNLIYKSLQVYIL
jgi:hypothetical protein